MHIAHLVITVLLATIVVFSGLGKIRCDPHQMNVIHETVGVPLKCFPLLAAWELARPFPVPTAFARCVPIILRYSKRRPARDGPGDVDPRGT
jgi:uncharacterized membrane protein YphA (DoxX/SURF4 family)